MIGVLAERVIRTEDGLIRIRPIARFPDRDYWIGENGSVWSGHKKGRGAKPEKGTLRRMKVSIRQTPGKGFGYAHICLRPHPGGKVQTLYVHALVLEAFVGPRPEPDYEVLHKNGQRADNRLTNIRWGSKAENAADKRAMQPAGFDDEIPN